MVVITEIRDTPLDPAAHETAVAQRSAGAVVSFLGVVRDLDHGRGVTLLEYEGHPDAARVLAEVAAEIAAGPDLVAVAVSHRVGTLSIGDVALVAAVSTDHRAAAFAAFGRLVDEAKRGCRSGNGRSSETAVTSGSTALEPLAGRRCAEPGIGRSWLVAATVISVDG